jgi:hypothetical protein
MNFLAILYSREAVFQYFIRYTGNFTSTAVLIQRDFPQSSILCIVPMLHCYYYRYFNFFHATSRATKIKQKLMY